MKLAFKLAIAPGTDLLDRMIAAHDNGICSHVELIMDRAWPRPPEARQKSWSARYGEGWFSRHLYYPKQKWDIYDVPCSEVQEMETEIYCEELEGVKYDMPGVLAFKGIVPHDRSDWFFCSEGILAVLQNNLKLWPNENPSKVSPNKLRELIRTM